MSRFMRGDSVEIMAGFPDNSIDFMSGSSSSLLRHRPSEPYVPVSRHTAQAFQ